MSKLLHFVYNESVNKSTEGMNIINLFQVITVEPGCYFITALLIPAMENAETSRFFYSDAIKRFMGFGGVRIESDVV